MHALIRYVLLIALRDRLFLGMLAAILCSTGLSSVLAATSTIEAHEMTLSFAAATARLILMLGLVVFVAFHLRHAFDSREVDVMLSRPISRPRLVFAYWVAFAVIALLMTLLALAVLYALGPLSLSGYAGWAFSLILEAWLMVAFTLFAALILRSGVATVLAAFGFYALSRMMGFFLVTVSGRTLFSSSVELNTLATRSIEWLSIAVPRLDFFAKTRWLNYGMENPQSDMLLCALQAGIFIPLLLVAAVMDFRKRQF